MPHFRSIPAIVATGAFFIGTLGSAGVVAAPIDPSDPANRDTTVRELIVTPLREIGRVRAKTSFCRTFADAASPAAHSALAFDVGAERTRRDLRDFDFASDLGHARSEKRVESDLRELVATIGDGRAELQSLKSTADSLERDQHDAVISFVDALDGAKNRQRELTRDIARTYAVAAEFRKASIADAPAADALVASGLRTLDIGERRKPGDPKSERSDLGRPAGSSDAYDDSVPTFTFAGDREIARDLIRAGAFARRIASLAGC